MSAPLPSSGSFLQAVRSSARIIRENSQIKIDPKDVERLLQSPTFTSSFQRVSQLHGLALPLKFSSPLAELNLISILSLLNFASGYRLPLHNATKRGAWDNIRALVFGMYISSAADEGDLMSARGMSGISEAKVAELMQVDIYVEKAHDSIPGVTVGELGGPLYELVKLIVGVLKETGKILLHSGYPDFGTFVAESLKEGARVKAGNNVPDADVEVVLEMLVRAFPAFQDMAVVDGQPVYCFKKALFLIHAIKLRFGSDAGGSPFPIPDTSRIPVFSDNVIPSLLIYLGVLDITSSPSLCGLFPGVRETYLALLEAPPSNTGNDSIFLKDGPFLSVDQAYILRAAAIDACEVIVETARTLPVALSLEWFSSITLPDVDGWLWSIAKDREDYRGKLERFVLRNTVFF
ncbi:hypothetical protein E1B28_009946 [Marasmius oreades]|uniref:Queuosine 5'-phosphate N-glycosylase/hydrolase n=1 Tax=Marasmius oreades TaxID=181124 RepID=A0A9P7RWU0_9AGAR|nr:uncharacterized protein E1B28_009946 [Marasmius oreades]KAG7090865.1 hypothetical protein E1B28_009946 [Marasmius oreades]